MNIALCSDSFIPIIDGVGTVVCSYANTLSKRNNDVYVITPLDNTGFRGRLGYEIVDYTSFTPLKTLPWKMGLDSIDTHLSERLKLIELDLIHVHTPGTSGFIGIKEAMRRDVPVIGSFHSKYYDDILKVTHSKAAAKLGAKLVAEFYGYCDEVWAVSENAADALKTYGYKGEIIVMPNGTNKRTLNISRIPEVREKFKIKNDIPVFLFVGQINWKKNIERILKSCALLKQQGTDFQLVLAGKGPDEKAILKMAEDLNITDNMIMTGHLEDTEMLDCLYSLADLFLFPSLYDNAPMVLREAACMHTPSVVIEGSSAAEVVKNMSNSLTCKDDSEDMTRTIKKYLELPDTEKELIRNNAYNTIPVPWDGELMDNIVSRYYQAIDRHKLLPRKTFFL